MTNIINITNRINDYDCYDPYYGLAPVSCGTDIETALDTALYAFDCCTPYNTCSYFEDVLTPFGTDERQCESDRVIAMFMTDLDEDLPF